MAIAEPQDPFGLWSLVRPRTEWPDTDETAIGAMADGWEKGGTSLATAITGLGDAGTISLASWRGGSGQTFAEKLTATQHLRGVQTGLAGMAVHARQFGEVVEKSKQSIVDNIGQNGPMFGLMSRLPGGAVFQEWFAGQVADGINTMLDTNAALLASQAPPERLTPQQILERNQTPADPGGMVDYFGNTITKTEADLLSSLGFWDWNGVRLTKSHTMEEAARRFLETGLEDGHGDAFRHVYLSAILTRDLGPVLAEQLTTAHEGAHGNRPDAEAMDKYNNEVGRRIAAAELAQNPGASNERLAELAERAVRTGRISDTSGPYETVVIDRGEIRYSTEVSDRARTGGADDPAPEPKVDDPPNYTG